MRHLFHYAGMTDVRAMRAEAIDKSRAGETVVLHLHPYVEKYDGCRNPSRRVHEVYRDGALQPHLAAEFSRQRPVSGRLSGVSVTAARREATA